ncbi:MAG TPA: signal peptidase I [Vicinamibacteria bacterium]|nr:signal peptidase I [Vicinamibacteria bacterium]
MSGPAAGNGAVPAFKKSVAREYLEAIVVAVVLALFVRTFAIQAFKIPTSSMEPNLLIGDHLFVNRLVYSPSIGRVEDLLLAKREVRRGDVVVFRFPENPEKDYVKRVVALPGETVEIHDKTVLVDGRPLDETAYVHFLDADQGESSEVEAGGLGGRERTPYGPLRVPEGQLFVLGDNRDNSNDSRIWGFLPRELVKGRALFVYWSYAATREEYRRSGALAWLRDTATALGRTRWDRFFHVIR